MILRRILSIDTETCLIDQALLAPPLVCVTWQFQGETPQIEHHSTIYPRLRAWLEDEHIVFVGHNVAYDFAVLAEAFPDLRPLIFAAYDADRVTDTKIRQQLLDIAGGEYRGRFGEKGRWIKHGYTLEDLGWRCADIRLQKDGWRLSYCEFLDTPLAQWPERAREVQRKAAERLAVLEARLLGGRTAEEKALKKEIEGLREMIASEPEQCLRYPLEDARATLAVWAAQERHVRYLDDQYRQVRAALAFHLSSCWGLRTDPEAVEELRVVLAQRLAELEQELISMGLVREDGTRDTKAAKARMLEVCRREGLPIRRTDAHLQCELEDACDEHVCLDEDACNATEDEGLMMYARLSTTKKQLTNDVEMLLQGRTFPISPRYDLAETGRSTCSKPNIQNLSTS